MRCRFWKCIEVCPKRSLWMPLCVCGHLTYSWIIGWELPAYLKWSDQSTSRQNLEKGRELGSPVQRKKKLYRSWYGQSLSSLILFDMNGTYLIVDNFRYWVIWRYEIVTLRKAVEFSMERDGSLRVSVDLFEEVADAVQNSWSCPVKRMITELYVERILFRS